MPSPLRVILLLASIPTAAALPARAAAPEDQSAPAAPSEALFRIVIWYDRSRPFDTFQHRAYNVSRGEYGRPVEDWRALMARAYPAYEVRVRDLTVKEGGPAAKAKIDAAVEEERYTLAKFILQKYSIGTRYAGSLYSSGYSGPGGAAGATRNHSPFEHSLPSSFPPLGQGFPSSSTPPYLFPNPFPIPFPNPLPYPRPHP